MSEQFFKELQELCKKHNASIYPGDINEDDLGVVVEIANKLGNKYYSLDVSKYKLKVSELD